MSGPVRIPTCLAMARGIIRNRISAPGGASAGAISGIIAARPIGQHLARPGLAPVPAVGRDRERLGPDHLAPDTAREAEAVAADPAQAGLVVIGRAEPGPRNGDDKGGISEARSQHRPLVPAVLAWRSAGRRPARDMCGKPRKLATLANFVPQVAIRLSQPARTMKVSVAMIGRTGASSRVRMATPSTRSCDSTSTRRPAFAAGRPFDQSEGEPACRETSRARRR